MLKEKVKDPSLGTPVCQVCFSVFYLAVHLSGAFRLIQLTKIFVLTEMLLRWGGEVPGNDPFK